MDPTLPQNVIDAVNKVNLANGAVNDAKSAETDASNALAAAQAAVVTASTVESTAHDATTAASAVAHQASTDLVNIFTAAFPNAFGP